MGIANAERALTYYRILAEFISQPEYKDVVLMWFYSFFVACKYLTSLPSLSIVNEILWSTIGEESIKSLYVKAHDTIRKSTYVCYLVVVCDNVVTHLLVELGPAMDRTLQFTKASKG